MKVKCEFVVDLTTGKYDANFFKVSGKGKIDSEILLKTLRKVIDNLEAQTKEIETFTKLLH